MADKKFLDLNGLGYTVRKMDKKKANIESPAFTGTPTVNGSDIITEASIDTKLDTILGEKLDNKIEETVGNKLDLKADVDSPELTGTPTAPTAESGDNSKQIANTEWVEDNYINRHGNAVVDGTLTVIGKTYPLLTLKSSTPTSSGYLMNIQGNLMFGNCMSNDASRQYYGRYVPALSKAIVGAVSIGYNPKDSANYKNTTDYGIKFDVDVANGSSATPTIQHQSGSFFVGVNGAYIGYSGDPSKAINFNTQVYKVLDSNNIKQDEYIKSLEQRIAELEAAVQQLTSAVEMLGV